VSGLKPKHAAFIRHFLGQASGNGTQAATLAGYSPKSAAQQAWTLLKNPKITEAIDAQQAALATTAGYTADRVISRLAAIADAPLDLAKLRPGDQVKALELLGKAHQLFQDKDASGERITVNIGFMASPEHNPRHNPEPRTAGRQLLSERPRPVVTRDTVETP
jgi:hypothetical protein